MLRKQKILQRLKIISILLVPMIMGASSCGERPDWTAKFWAGDSDAQGITRSQDNITIECKEPNFDDYVCLSYEDLNKLESEVLSRCTGWN